MAFLTMPPKQGPTVEADCAGSKVQRALAYVQGRGAFSIVAALQAPDHL